MHTSLKFSKKLKEAGCKLKSQKSLTSSNQNIFATSSSSDYNKIICSAYHILEDICVRYAKEFFEKPICKMCKSSNLNKNCLRCTSGFKYHTQEILKMIQQDKPQEEIEAYIWDNCLFNKKKEKNEE